MKATTGKAAAGKAATAQQQLATAAQAQEQGRALTGPDGLLKELTKTVLEAALNAAMTEHASNAFESHRYTSGNSRTLGPTSTASTSRSAET